MEKYFVLMKRMLRFSGLLALALVCGLGAFSCAK